jgi:hypothetical protein
MLGSKPDTMMEPHGNRDEIRIGDTVIDFDPETGEWFGYEPITV